MAAKDLFPTPTASIVTRPSTFWIAKASFVIAACVFPVKLRRRPTSCSRNKGLEMAIGCLPERNFLEEGKNGAGESRFGIGPHSAVGPHPRPKWINGLLDLWSDERRLSPAAFRAIQSSSTPLLHCPGMV